MVKLLIITIITYFLVITSAVTTRFCSVVCGTRCTSNLNSECGNSCQSDGAWVASGTTCIPKSSSGWKLADSTPDYGGALTVTGASTTTTACNNMNYYGYVTPSVAISVATPGITIPYFAMRIYVGIIAIDVNCWGGGGGGGGGSCGSGPTTLIQGTTSFSVFFNDPEAAQATNPFFTPTISNNPTKTDYCGTKNNFREYYYRVTRSYPAYSTLSTPLQWDISCTETANASALWGIRQFLIIVQSCNIACLTCYGAAATQCYTCATNYWLSNNTCSLTCLNHFGEGNNFICIYCDLRCSACYMEMDNCTSCTVSGIWAAYLSTTVNSNYPTCINPCPDGYFANKVTRTCDICDSVCATCINKANYCTSCIIDSTYWTGWYCYNPCPDQYFLDPNGTNCTKCNPYCSVCSLVSTNCSQCVLSGQFMAYLENTTSLYGNCARVCSSGFYGETYGGVGPNLCLPCDINCSLCTSFPTPCAQCIPGFYLIDSTCTDTCPNGTISSNATGTGLCLNCDLVCVGLTINMYFPVVTHDKIYIDMTFDQDLNYSTFVIQTFQNIIISSDNIQYTSSMFTFTYTNLSTRSYRITIEPKTYIFLYNATFQVLTKDQPDPIDYSLQQMPFKSSNYLKTASLKWFLIKGPPFNSLQMGIMNSLSKLSTKTNKVLALPYIQQIKKTGVFALLFSGAQATSFSMLSNQIQSQNLYEGVRIWAVFVFFDAPPYEQISDKTKRFVSPTVQDKIRNAQQVAYYSNRALFSTDKMYWRFQRTGQTSFFIYDVYMPIFLIILCWAGIILAYYSAKKRWYNSYASNLYSAVHKIHEMQLMYITMASIVEFIYFEPTSSQRVISAIVCVIFNVYFVVYELYIYQDMIKYPLAQIGNKYYDYYVLRYGFFLKNVRFQQYDIHDQWSPNHWFRPYNFHILSYYKKFLMIIVLPLFYSVMYAQMGILMFLQLLQLIRVWVTWPFVSKARNIIRLTLQFALFMFFMINTIQVSVLQTIMTSDTDGLQSATKLFYGIGWTGFACCMYFNLAHIFLGIYDFCVGLKISNRAKMDKARKKYYSTKIKQYEQDNEASSKVLVNQWVKLGNLNDKSYGELPQVNVRIEMYEFKKFGTKFELKIKKITSLKMKEQLKRLRKSNNTTVGGKIERVLVINQADSSRLYSIINDVYRLYEGPHVETIRIKTFLNVWQKDYQEGQEIPFDRNLMFQRVQLISYDNQFNEFRLQSILEDFPIKQSIINNAI